MFIVDSFHRVNRCSRSIMSGGFQFGTPNTTAAATAGTGIGAFSFGTPSSQTFAFGTPSCTASGSLFGSAATPAASFGTAAGAGSLFGVSTTQPAATSTAATTTGFTFGMYIYLLVAAHIVCKNQLVACYLMPLMASLHYRYTGRAEGL